MFPHDPDLRPRRRGTGRAGRRRVPGAMGALENTASQTLNPACVNETLSAIKISPSDRRW